jgi:hypothetical protein
MKHMFRKYSILVIFAFTACELNGDLENPNQISLAGADVNLIMNSIQLDFSNFFNSAERSVNPLCRMEAMTGGFRYQTANTPQGQNGIWNSAYADILVNAMALIPLAEDKGLTTHVAVAKILSAYTYLTLVDIFGDIPQLEALSASSGNFNPVLTGGEQVYDYAISLLDEARTELAKTGSAAGAALTRDIFYNGSRSRWNALANTLELKAQVNLAMVPARQAGANARIAVLLGTDLIDTEAENFTYKYGTATVPVSRHPLYRQYYQVAGGAGGYIANHYLYELFAAKGLEDPRWRYYFYRQVGSISKATDVDPKALGCAPGAPPNHYITSGVPVFCVFDPGFYGRDHGDGFGTPPDGPVLTCAGIYPAGGKIDNTSTASASFHGPIVQGDGANGAGIHPIWMSFYTDFVKAEIKARANDLPGAEADMLNGINNSITQIRNFATSKGQVLSPGREPSTSAYIAAVQALYAAALSQDEKIDVIAREYYAALWGNGVEAYNSLRRTGSPTNLQPTLQINPGPFYRSMIYPADHIGLNENAVQKDFNATNRVFWDTDLTVIE